MKFRIFGTLFVLSILVVLYALFSGGGDASPTQQPNEFVPSN